MSGDLSPDPNLAGKRREVERRVREFEERALVGLQGHFNQLVYLASLRDYNTAVTTTTGWRRVIRRKAVDEGLHQLHVRVFEELVALPLKEETEDLLDFFESVKEGKARMVVVWTRLKSYQILPPAGAHPPARELLIRTLRLC
jgi:hypothetical protein